MKRLLSLLLAALMLFALASAAQAKTVITYGDWVLEKIDNDTHISLDQYLGEDRVVYVPRLISDMMVVNIADHCFAKNEAIGIVYTSSPMMHVGDYAFIECTALESFRCNHAMTSIGVGAFSGCTSLSQINLEESKVTVIKSHTFTDTALVQVALPETCTCVEEYAFLQCGQLERILIPDSVTEIAETAFNGCDNLVIYCNSESYAQSYAEAQGIEYVLIDVPVVVNYLLGDADGNGKINILDATKIQRLLVRLVDDTEGMITLRADCNQNGIDIMDATRIQRFLANFTVQYPIGEPMTATFYMNPFET